MTKLFLVQIKMADNTREKCPPEVLAHNIGYAVQNVADRMTEGPRPTITVSIVESMGADASMIEKVSTGKALAVLFK